MILPEIGHGLAVLLAFVVSAWLCRRFHLPGSLFHVLDHPGERSLHKTATPRSGGVAIVIAILSAWGAAAILGNMQWNDALSWISAGVVLLALVGGIDDRLDLPPLKRLLAQLLAAFFLLAAGLAPANLQLPGIVLPIPCYLAFVGTVLFVLWMTNLYNFMDGMDGFAGGMAVIGFAAMAFTGWQAEKAAFMYVALVIAAACLGFLLFNFPPARIFMGDAGAPVLGFLAAALMLWADRQDIFPLWVGILIFSPFVVDASYTLLRRLLAGKRIWQAHREHLYQRLVQMGWSHRRTVLRAYVLMLAVAVSTMMTLNRDPLVQWMLILFWTMLYGFLIGWVHRKESVAV